LAFGVRRRTLALLMKGLQPADLLDHRAMQSVRPVELQTDVFLCVSEELTSYRPIEGESGWRLYVAAHATSGSRERATRFPRLQGGAGRALPG
jgi:hypothetical protein